MKKDVLITIKGIQRADGDNDVVELFTMGRFYRRNGSYYISYDESEATGYEGSKTTLRVDENQRVTMSRSGSLRSQLIIERGVRHQCNYDTGHGSFTIGVLGDSIVSSLTDQGGDIEFKYSLDVNASLTSENEVYINVKEPAES